MQKKQVAVLDISSSEITAVFGERGINNTFIIKSRSSFKYDGFSDGVFFNIPELTEVINKAVDSLIRVSKGELVSIYVGVPGEFTEVLVKNGQISFPSKKKIKEEDEDLLFDSAFVIKSNKYTLINRSAICYELDDFRRVSNPIGYTSEILKGKLSFILCKNYFIDLIAPIIKDKQIFNIEWVSISLAEAMYLLEDEIRDRIAVVADIGHISTTLTIVNGDGLLYQDAFSFGGGFISAGITENFSMNFNDAEKVKDKINLCILPKDGEYGYLETDNGTFLNIGEINKIALSNLDFLCEKITESLESSGYSLPEYVPLYITGGGITGLRGAKEHISKRLGMVVEVLAPSVPMMDKPTESAVLSLLDIALMQ